MLGEEALKRLVEDLNNRIESVELDQGSHLFSLLVYMDLNNRIERRLVMGGG